MLKKTLTLATALAAHTAFAAPNVISAGSMKFVEIPAGSYLMGSSESDADRREKPAHRETV